MLCVCCIDSDFTRTFVVRLLYNRLKNKFTGNRSKWIVGLNRPIGDKCHKSLEVAVISLFTTTLLYCVCRFDVAYNVPVSIRCLHVQPLPDGDRKILAFI